MKIFTLHIQFINFVCVHVHVYNGSNCINCSNAIQSDNAYLYVFFLLRCFKAIFGCGGVSVGCKTRGNLHFNKSF